MSSASFFLNTAFFTSSLNHHVSPLPPPPFHTWSHSTQDCSYSSPYIMSSASFFLNTAFFTSSLNHHVSPLPPPPFIPGLIPLRTVPTHRLISCLVHLSSLEPPSSPQCSCFYTWSHSTQDCSYSSPYIMSSASFFLNTAFFTSSLNHHVSPLPPSPFHTWSHSTQDCLLLIALYHV